MKKLLIGVLALGALAGLASCELPDVLKPSEEKLGKLSEEDWNTAKSRFFSLVDCSAGRYGISAGIEGTTRTTYVDGSKIEASAGTGVYYASWTTSASTGRSYTFYFPDAAGAGYLATEPGEYSINEFKEFGDYTSIVLLAAIVNSAEYSSLTHLESDTLYHVSLNLEDAGLNLKMDIDKTPDIKLFDVNGVKVSMIKGKTITLPTPSGSYTSHPGEE